MEDYNISIHSVLSDDITKLPKLQDVLISTLPDTKNISSFIVELNRLMPLEKLYHLKRVKKNQLILCSIDQLLNILREENDQFQACLRKEFFQNGNEKNLSATFDAFEKIDFQKMLKRKDSIDKSDITFILRSYLAFKQISLTSIDQLCEKISIMQIVSARPKVRYQYEYAVQFWPVKFHPDKNLENLYQNNVFTEDDRKKHAKFMKFNLRLSKYYQNCSIGIAVNGQNGKIIAVTRADIQSHPLKHCSMVLVDAVAKTQNGGVWPESCKFYRNFNFMSNLTNISEDLCDFLINNCNDNEANSNLLFEPYLCTGYDIYLTFEPCIMCSMALSHSRVRRIFFHNSQENGAIQTKFKLQGIAALNHHYEIFQTKIDDKPYCQM